MLEGRKKEKWRKNNGGKESGRKERGRIKSNVYGKEEKKDQGEKRNSRNCKSIKLYYAVLLRIFM
jgi:hypothetical protein